MAGLEGLEPPTKGLGNLCSIHLSYSPVAEGILRSGVPPVNEGGETAHEAFWSRCTLFL